jgi:hypothetical protein
MYFGTLALPTKKSLIFLSKSHIMSSLKLKIKAILTQCGEGGIRTLDRGLHPYNRLANDRSDPKKIAKLRENTSKHWAKTL